MAYQVEQVLRKTEVDGDFRQKIAALKKSVKRLVNEWESFTEKEMEFFLQYCLDGAASREFFLGNYEGILASFDPNRSLTTARKKFTQRINAVANELNPTLVDFDTGRSIYDGGAGIKNRALNDFIFWLMTLWQENGGKTITDTATHSVIEFVQHAISELKTYAETHGTKEQQDILEAGHSKATVICRRLAKGYRW
jgi:hypothetical protein